MPESEQYLSFEQLQHLLDQHRANLFVLRQQQAGQGLSHALLSITNQIDVEVQAIERLEQLIERRRPKMPLFQLGSTERPLLNIGGGELTLNPDGSARIRCQFFQPLMVNLASLTAFSARITYRFTEADEPFFSFGIHAAQRWYPSYSFVQVAAWAAIKHQTEANPGPDVDTYLHSSWHDHHKAVVGRCEQIVFDRDMTTVRVQYGNHDFFIFERTEQELAPYCYLIVCGFCTIERLDIYPASM